MATNVNANHPPHPPWKMKRRKKKDKEEAWPDSPDTASNHKSIVGGINFTSGAVPKHDEMGFTPYFDKNCWELRGPIPLTILNKKWKNAAIIHHTEKQSQLEDLSS